VPLPIAAEIQRLLRHRQTRKAVHLFAIRGAAVIFPPRRFLRVTEQIRASDVMMVTDLGATHTAEKFLCPIRASAVQAAGFVVVDPADLVTLVQFFP